MRRPLTGNGARPGRIAPVLIVLILCELIHSVISTHTGYVRQGDSKHPWNHILPSTPALGTNAMLCWETVTSTEIKKKNHKKMQQVPVKRDFLDFFRFVCVLLQQISK